MLFLFSLINISFTSFFFLFGKYMEGALFGIISLLFIIYFSKILSLFIEKKDDPHAHAPEHKKAKSITIKNIIELFKKWSYYLAFLLFYISLYGFIYSINLIYQFFDSSEIFHYITFAISLVITIIFFVFRQKNHETIFRIFRSNCIVFTVIYSFFIFFFLIEGRLPNIFFIINSIFPIITLGSVIIYDSFFKDKKEYIYLLFLFYTFLMGWYYSSLIFLGASFFHITLLVLSFFMVVYTFLFPRIKYFYVFRTLSQAVWIYMSYVLSFATILSILFEPLSYTPLFLLALSIGYNYVIYRLFKNKISYIFSLLGLISLYIKIFLVLWGDSLASYGIFIFLLPFIFIGASYVIPMKNQKDVYILHFFSIVFSIVAIVYSLIEMQAFDDMLWVSILFFFESILIFVSYVQLKK